MSLVSNKLAYEWQIAALAFLQDQLSLASVIQDNTGGVEGKILINVAVLAPADKADALVDRLSTVVTDAIGDENTMGDLQMDDDND